jgi:2-methylcitrate dehydratase PrpD
MSKNGNEITANFILSLRWDNLAHQVHQRAQLCLLDALGCILAGSTAPVARLTASAAAAFWPGQTSTILLQGQSSRAAGAAFANAWAANALDIDDDAIFTRGHPGAQLIPTVLAVGEQTGASGKEILEALVIGYEVAIQAGRCWHAHHEIYQSCGSWGSLACAAAAARLLGLNSHEIQHALGIAEYHAPNAPMLRDIANPSMVKHAVGWGAMNGIISCELAQRGFTGIPSLLGFDEYRDWVADLGQHFWMVEGVTYKGWASCAWGHAACQAAFQLIQQEQLHVGQIKHIRVHTFDEAVRLTQDYPTTTEEAQFSLKWPLACLLIDGEIGPRQVLEPRLQDPQVRRLFDKIELILDPHIDQLYKDTKEMDIAMYSSVEMSLVDGRSVDSGLVERGSSRWDQSSLENKFRWLVANVLNPQTVEVLLDLVSSFENLENVSELTGLLKYVPVVQDSSGSQQ